MDQGVIKSLKAHYHRCLVRLITEPWDQGQDLQKISIRHVLQLLGNSWNDVTKTNVKNNNLQGKSN